jgi:hypothetical protein
MNSTETGDCSDPDNSLDNGKLFRLRIVGGNYDGQCLQSEDCEITIGSDPESTFVFDRPDVHPLHCLIEHIHQTTILDSRQGAVLVNGQNVTNRTLTIGDQIQIGGVTLHVENLRNGDRAYRGIGDNELNGATGFTVNTNKSRRIGKRRVAVLIEQLRSAKSIIRNQHLLLQQYQLAEKTEIRSAKSHQTQNKWIDMIQDLDLDEVDPGLLELAVFENISSK